jgi:thiol:disulfide interchange protein DsbA
MKMKKPFFITFSILLLASIVIFPALCAQAQQQDNQPFSAILKPVLYEQSDDKIEIVYFFWYGCSHCFHSDQTTSLFLNSLPNDVRAVRLPAIFEPEGDSALHGRLYFTLDEMGVEKDLRDKAFKAAQNLNDAGVPNSSFHGYGLVSKQAQETFAAANKLSRESFSSAFDSPAVESRFEKAYRYLVDTDVNAVPTLIINGRYRLPYGPNFYQLAEELINKERERLAGSKADNQ